MTEWKPGQPCRVVEHDEATREPKAGGEVYAATVIELAGVLVWAEFMHPGYKRPLHRSFYARTGWAAKGGEHGWRLMPAEPGAPVPREADR